LILTNVRLGEFEVVPPAATLDGSSQTAGYFFVTVDLPGQANCGTTHVIGVSAPSQPGDVTIALTPGYAVPPGYVVDVTASQFSGAYVTAYGYSVPATDAGTTPTATRSDFVPPQASTIHR
jgi:hypothetical protein